MHRRWPNGLTLYTAIGRVVRDRDRQAFRLTWPPMLDHGEERLEHLRETVRRLGLHRPAAGTQAPAFVHVGRTEWSNAWQAELLTAAATLARSAADLADAQQRLLSLLGVAIEADRRGLAALAALVGVLQSAAGIDLGFAFGVDAAKLLEQAPQAVTLVRNYRAELVGLPRPLDPATVRSLPVAELEAAWALAVKSIWPLSVSRKKAVMTRLDPSATIDPDTALPCLHRLQVLLASLDALPHANVLPGWNGVSTDLERLERTVKVAGDLRPAMAGAVRTPDQLIDLRGALRRLCVDANDMLAPEGAVGSAGQRYLDAYAAFIGAKTGFEITAATPVPIDAPQLPSECQAIAEACAAGGT